MDIYGIFTYILVDSYGKCGLIYHSFSVWGWKMFGSDTCDSTLAFLPRFTPQRNEGTTILYIYKAKRFIPRDIGEKSQTRIETNLPKKVAFICNAKNLII